MSKTKLAVIALIIANIIWGAAAPIFKWSLQDIHPFTLAFLRFFLPTLFIGLIAPNKLKIKIKHFLLFLVAGFFGVSINIGAFFIGIEHTASINSPIISSAGPVFLILGSILFLKEKPSKKMLIGNLIGLTGVLLIVLEPILHTSPNVSIYGNFLLILATLGSIIGTIAVKDLTKYYSAFTISFWSFLIGSITFFPFAFSEYQKFGLIQQLHFQGLMGVLFGAVLSSFIAYTLLFWALKYLMASQTTVFTYMDPVVAILIAAPLVHEYPTAIFGFGTILVFLGMYVAERRIPYHPIGRLLRK